MISVLSPFGVNESWRSSGVSHVMKFHIMYLIGLIFLCLYLSMICHCESQKEWSLRSGIHSLLDWLDQRRKQARKQRRKQASNSNLDISTTTQTTLGPGNDFTKPILYHCLLLLSIAVLLQSRQLTSEDARPSDASLCRSLTTKNSCQFLFKAQ